MKKFYAFFTATLMSVSVFAAKDVVPSDAVLANYYDQGNVCVCIFVPADMACNNIVLTGKFNEWSSSADNCIPFEAVEGYDGWYVASFEPEAEPDAEKGIQAKPVMLDGDGKFSWDYQVGAATVIRGGVQVVDGFSGEIDLINYGADAPNVYTVDAWKNNPCTAVYHHYTVVVLNSHGCDNSAVPFIVGAFNNWTFQQMQFDIDKSKERQAGYFYYTFKAAESSEYQIVSGLLNEAGDAVEVQPAWEDEAYLQVYNEEGKWVRFLGTGSNGNLVLGEEVEVNYDFTDASKYRWARCVERVFHDYTVKAKLPLEGAPASVELVGGWQKEEKEDDVVVTPSSWDKGVVMTFENGEWTAAVKAYEGCEFKFRSEGSWDQEIEIYNEEEDEWSKPNQEFGEEAAIELDFSGEYYRWSEPQGIENVVLTEKAQKVVVDGVIYIIRNNKMFNIQGAQVR